MIQFLRHKEIDFKKWDNCIDNAINGLPYGYSWYLNIAAEELWDALVLDDYKAVFPLPFKNRILFKQIYQPFFVQQLGLFYTDISQKEELNNFIEAIPKQFRKINLQLNTQNQLQSSLLKIKNKITHHIDLNMSYENIASKYNTNTKRNLKNATTFNLSVSENISPEQIINYRKKYLHEKISHQNEKDILRLQKIIEKSMSMNAGFISGVSDEKNELLAVVFFLHKNNHIIYLSAVSSPEGINKNAMTLLIDNTLKKYAGTKNVFDFEGSMISGLARFYKGFGAQEISFPVIYK